MFEYIIRLLILIPFVGGLAWGSLWLWRKAQVGMPIAPARGAGARLTNVISLGASGKLAVVEFGGRELLISASRTQITLIADGKCDD